MAEDKDAVITWMHNNPELLGWDLIVAVDTQQLNPGLTQAQLVRWQAGDNIADLEGEYDIGGLNIQHCVSNMRLAAPALTLGWASEARPTVNVAINVEGTRTTVEKPQKVRALYRFDALDPAQLTYTQLLDGKEGGLLLDLAEGEGHRFDSRMPPTEQLEAGRFFQRKLETLSAAQRRYPLAGQLQVPENDFLAIRHISATTRLSADEKRQALLMFAATKHSSIGGLPGAGEGFPFLLPADIGAGQSGTLLMNMASLQRAAYGRAIDAMFEAGALNYRYDMDNQLLQIEGKAGALEIPETEYSTSTFTFKSDAFKLGVAGLVVDFTGADVHQRWQVTQPVTLTYTRKKASTSAAEIVEVEVAFALDHLFWLLRDDRATKDQAQVLTRGQVMAPAAGQPVRLVSELPGFSESERAEVEAFIGYAVTRGFYNGLAPNLLGRTGDLCLETFSVAGTGRFDPATAQVEAPNNLALFSELRSDEQTVRIVQKAVLLKERQVQQFTLETPVAGVKWTVEALPGSAGVWGEVTDQGEYTAPRANAMAGKPARVLVVATDPATNARSVAHVTVLANAVSVNPHIQVTQPGQSLALSAGSIGGAELTWEILQPGPGSGTLLPAEQGQGRTYKAGQRVDDAVFIIDRIAATNSAGESAQAYVLVEQTVPELAVLLAESGQPEYGVQLEARFQNRPLKGVQWWLPLEGPGFLDENGLYEPDFYSHEAFVLIAARWATEDFGNFEGYIILPLPLDENSRTLRLLTAGYVAAPQTGC
ncbi:hypothetical protein F3J44_28505 [Pantoea sp. Tr-811]|uniref:hypothetical protein n=1 Tax=Pantoea sp. Tr-811 TaxID=2608361 RepID=UPI001423A8D4|nr:hypothetical protein [Pantoea sp. Tr-811]NIF30283.1 hypothetical protein [Pantoea sp. Tr-811]